MHIPFDMSGTACLVCSPEKRSVKKYCQNHYFQLKKLWLFFILIFLLFLKHQCFSP